MRGIFILFFFFLVSQSFGQFPDTVKPIITLRGDVALFICPWTHYVDAGYDVSDNVDSRSEIRIDTLGTFKITNGPGLYTLIFKATDKAGNFSYSNTRYIEIRRENDLFCDVCHVGYPYSTGIDEKSNKVQFKFYPTISSGIFYISSQKPQMITGLNVYNITGEQIKSRQGNELIYSQYKLDLSDMVNGIYFIRISTGTSEVVQKVVIQR
jgi:hypothetical protein